MTAHQNLTHPSYGLQVLRFIDSDAAWPTGLDLPATDAAAKQRGFYMDEEALALFSSLQADVPQPTPVDFTIEVATIAELRFWGATSLNQVMAAAQDKGLKSFPLQYAAALRLRYGGQQRGHELMLAVDEPLGERITVPYLRHGNRRANALLAKLIDWKHPLPLSTRFVFARPCPIN